VSVELDLTGSVALVTGAGRGIGRAIALSLAAAGADVVVNDFADETACTAVLGEIEQLGRKGLVVMGDVSDEEQVNAMVERAESELGPLAVVVNNAGITRDNVVMMMDPGDFDSVIATHLRGTFLVSKAAARKMFRRRSGCIINLSSVVGRRGNAGQANYAAAKAGVAGMTRSLARELGSRGITVNCVAPGFIETDMTKSLSEAQTTALMAQIPLGRLGHASDIAHAVAFLASPQAGYITGTELHVNGGMYMN